MPGKGPAPLPTALKVLRGSKRINTREPAAGDGEPVQPADFNEAERAAWAETIAEMQTVPGLVKRADRGVLELVARTVPAYREAARHVREHGSTVVARDERGGVKFVQVSPQMQTAIKLAALLKTLYAELGLTPSGRSRLNLQAENTGASWRDALSR